MAVMAMASDGTVLQNADRVPFDDTHTTITTTLNAGIGNRIGCDHHGDNPRSSGLYRL